jgi:hypothetical protein
MIDPIDETTDGPDVLRAREVLDQLRTDSVETDKVLEEQRRLAKTLESIGRKNHFADKFRKIIQGAA